LNADHATDAVQIKRSEKIAIPETGTIKDRKKQKSPAERQQTPPPCSRQLKVKREETKNE